jgi:hypothetical protein
MHVLSCVSQETEIYGALVILSNNSILPQGYR